MSLNLRAPYLIKLTIQGFVVWVCADSMVKYNWISVECSESRGLTEHHLLSTLQQFLGVWFCMRYIPWAIKGLTVVSMACKQCLDFRGSCWRLDTVEEGKIVVRKTGYKEEIVGWCLWYSDGVDLIIVRSLEYIFTSGSSQEGGVRLYREQRTWQCGTKFHNYIVRYSWLMKISRYAEQGLRICFALLYQAEGPNFRNIKLAAGSLSL